MRLLNRIRGNEAGLALVTALVLLLVGGFFVVTCVALLGTTLTANRMVDAEGLELYAADAGVEHALWHFKYDMAFQFPTAGGENSIPFPETISDRTVSVIVSNEGEYGYKISSTAVSDDGESTTVESYVAFLDFDWLFDSAITSPSDVVLMPGTDVSGNVKYGGELDNKGTINGNEIIDPEMAWPKASQLSGFYWPEVEDLTPLPTGSTIGISSGTEADPYILGPLSAAGDLTITGSGWAMLGGTLYIKGDLVIMPNGTIDLNGQTIYVEGNIQIQPNCIIVGSGCIIAEGFVDFQPTLNSTPDDFVFVMSVQGTADIKPNGSLYGSVAGAAEVQLQPGNTLELTSVPEGGLNFPDGSEDFGYRALEIRTYTIL